MPTARKREAALVQLLATGDRTAFEQVYRKHNTTLIRVATGIVRSRATAEEVAQETWIAVLKSISGFEGRSSLASWIFSILINKARSRAKREGRIVSFDGAGEDDNLTAAFDGRGRWKDMPELWETLTPRAHSGRTQRDGPCECRDRNPAAWPALRDHFTRTTGDGGRRSLHHPWYQRR